MSQGNDFANYASSSSEERSAASEDVWFVAVSSDDIKQMTVDQLDEAFRLGVISAQTAVWTEGMEAWAPLGEVADLDADSDAASESGAEEPAAHTASFATQHSRAEHSLGEHAQGEPARGAPSFDAQHEPSLGHGSSGSTEGLRSQRRTNPGWQNPFDAPASAAPNSYGGSTPGAFGDVASRSSSSLSMGPSSFAPVTASYAPPGSSLGQSTGPVALNVDEDMPLVSRGRRFRPERWLLAAAGVVAVGVIGFNNADLFSSKSMAAAEKQASAAALVTHPYELGADKSKGAAPAEKAEKDDGKDAPIGSLKGEAGEEEEAAAPAAVTPDLTTKPGSSAKETAKDPAAKDAASKDSMRGSFAKAFSKTAPAAKPAKGAKAAKAAKLAHKTPSRAAAAKPRKGAGVARAASAFDPLNGSLP